MSNKGNSCDCDAKIGYYCCLNGVPSYQISQYSTMFCLPLSITTYKNTKEQ